jgi:hypothetical protein
MNDQPVEQVQYVDLKIMQFNYICETFRIVLRGKARLKSQLKLYKIMMVPTAIHGSEAWTVRSSGTWQQQ